MADEQEIAVLKPGEVINAAITVRGTGINESLSHTQRLAAS